MIKDLDRRTFGKIGFAGAGGLLLPAAAPDRSLTAERCRVEWQVDPIGIDTLRPRFRWLLKANGTSADSVLQRGYRIILIGGIGSGKAGKTLFDSGWRTGSMPAFTRESSLPLRSHAAYLWHLAIEDSRGRRSAVTPAGRFVTGILQESEWNAQWIAGRPDGAPSRQTQEWQQPVIGAAEAMPLLRGSFDEPRQVAAAYLSVVGLGHYALFIDGTPLADGELRSGWTDYRKTVLYDTFDVSQHIKPGRTILAAMLGNGFYNVEGVVGRYSKFVGSYGQPKLRLQLRMIFADESEKIVTSDATWSVAEGPIQYSSIYGGEDFDARLIPAAWSRSPMPSAAFRPVDVVGGPGGILHANGLLPVACTQRYDRPEICTVRPGILVADFGQNFSGRPALALTGVARGQSVTMKPGELLMPDGTVDQRSMTGRNPGYGGIAFTYTSAGPERQEWRPRFTYTGFRYLQIEGATREQIASLVGEFTHLSVPRTGHFDCSDRQLVAIHALIDQALRGNLASVVTDCPHREKLGWLEQIYLNAGTAMYNRDVAALYEKMAGDMRDAQLATGAVPSIAPEFVAFVDRAGRSTKFRDSPEWGCAIVVAPWAMYRTYGDTRILEQCWPAMQAYAEYLSSRAVNGIVDHGLGDWFDIGPRTPGESQLTSTAFTGTATLFAALTSLAGVAQVLGRNDDVARYTQQAGVVRDTINRRFLDSATGRYDRGSQAAQAMAIALDIVPDSSRPQALAALLRDIAARQDHVSAGDVGFHYVVRALSSARRGDVMYRMLNRTDAPSYGDQLHKGATALTEAWDSARHASQNHFMLGHAESWLYGALGGIVIDFARSGTPLMIAPQPVAGIGWVDVSFDTVLGEVRSVWRRIAGRIVMEVEVPAGATAVIHHPDGRRPIQIGDGNHRL